MSEKFAARARRMKSTRAKIKRLGLEHGVLRLCVNRSIKHISAQVIEPATGNVLASSTSLDLRKEGKVVNKKDQAKVVGQMLAKKVIEAGLAGKKLASDCSGFKYHGRVAAFFDGAREEGLVI